MLQLWFSWNRQYQITPVNTFIQNTFDFFNHLHVFFKKKIYSLHTGISNIKYKSVYNIPRKIQFNWTKTNILINSSMRIALVVLSLLHISWLNSSLSIRGLQYYMSMVGNILGSSDRRHNLVIMSKLQPRLLRFLLITTRCDIQKKISWMKKLNTSCFSHECVYLSKIISQKR